MSAVEEGAVPNDNNMEDGEDEIMDPEEGMDGGMDEDPEGDDNQNAEYIKKEFIARPYKSEFGTDEEVERFKVVNSR